MRRLISKFLLVSFILIIPVFASAQASLVNINTASTTELKTLNGIGDVKAQAIIDYRNTHGLFQKIEDIKNVSGIGDVTYNNIKNFITVGDIPTTATTTENTTIVTVEPSSPSTSSVHFSSSPVGVNKSQTKISLSIGRDRLGSVGSPLEFKVETDMNYTRSSIFKWNFGDGSQGNGEVLTHTYQYPGDYVVVLNVSTPGGQAVARINVKIIEPDLTVVSATRERIELKNNAKQEISLFGRALVSSGQTFLFAQDTIIKAGQSISFDNHVTGLHPGNSLDVALLVVGERRMVSQIEEEKQKQISSIQSKIATLQSQIAQNHEPFHPASVLETVPVPALAATSYLPALAVKSSWFNTLKHFFLRKP